MNYDAAGNITYKSDVGCYHYDETGNAGPHALTSITDKGTYTYDANGNVISSPDYTASYTSFNKPSTIIKGDKELRFDYGPGHARYHQVVWNNGTLSKEVFYVGGLYEKSQTFSGIREKHYIPAGGSVIAVYTSSTISGTPDETVYLHKDHLGSVTEITDENGAIKESFSYDAWGKRRNPFNWTSGGSFDLLPFYDRGFTNHEHLDEVGLIHMNGRVYDPTIARFLSADPIIQAPDNTQSLNRYSYVLNDPLTNIDPTGFFSFSKAFKSISKAFKKISKVFNKVVKAVSKAVSDVWDTVWNGVKPCLQNQYVAIVVQVVASYFGPLGAALAAGVITMANGGSFGDALKAGAFAFASAYGSSVIGGSLSGVGTKAVAHGAFQGALSEAQGGKFEHGFLSGVAGSLGGEYIKAQYDNGNINYVTAVGANAIVGGTASKLGGGKFANGAVSGATIMIYNHMDALKREIARIQEDKFGSFRTPDGKGIPVIERTFIQHSGLSIGIFNVFDFTYKIQRYYDPEGNQIKVNGKWEHASLHCVGPKLQGGNNDITPSIPVGRVSIDCTRPKVGVSVSLPALFSFDFSMEESRTF